MLAVASPAAAQTRGLFSIPSFVVSIAVNADGSVSAFFGKMDMGQGLFTAIGQMVAEELEGVQSATVELVWEPYWTPERMDPRVKAFMGF